MNSSFSNLRIGIGHDTHRLGPGGPLRIGGLDIDFDQHLIGHSDADVLLHAVTDALLGATALGDIGTLFPNDDPHNRDRDSAEMLTHAFELVRQAGFELINIDCIIFAERPKFVPHNKAIRQHLSRLLDLSIDCVGLKAKTGEGIGPIGQGQAIASQCIALLRRSDA